MDFTVDVCNMARRQALMSSPMCATLWPTEHHGQDSSHLSQPVNCRSSVASRPHMLHQHTRPSVPPSAIRAPNKLNCALQFVSWRWRPAGEIKIICRLSGNMDGGRLGWLGEADSGCRDNLSVLSVTLINDLLQLVHWWDAADTGMMLLGWCWDAAAFARILMLGCCCRDDDAGMLMGCCWDEDAWRWCWML